MSRIERTELQRFVYWQGQMLRTSDFRDQEIIDGQRRWWHNRALHSAFGVCYGLGTSSIPNQGSGVDITHVHVEPGVAYDCFGRELILQLPQDIPVPESPPIPMTASQGENILVLLIHYKDTDQYRRRGYTPGSCLHGRCSAIPEKPEFHWKPLHQVSLGDGVPISQVIYDQKGKYLDPRFRPTLARSLTRPRTASGTTIAGGTEWEVGVREIHDYAKRYYVSPDGEISVAISLQLEVDTSATGFSIAPCCLASIRFAHEGYSYNDFAQEMTKLFDGMEVSRVMPFTYINNISSSRFRFDLLLVLMFTWKHSPFSLVATDHLTPANAVFAMHVAAQETAQRNMFISWFAVEPEE